MFKDGDIMDYMIQQTHQILTGGKKKGRVPRPERKSTTNKRTSKIRLGEAARVAPGVLRYRAEGLK